MLKKRAMLFVQDLTWRTIFFYTKQYAFLCSTIGMAIKVTGYHVVHVMYSYTHIYHVMIMSGLYLSI